MSRWNWTTPTQPPYPSRSINHDDHHHPNKANYWRHHLILHIQDLCRRTFNQQEDPEPPSVGSSEERPKRSRWVQPLAFIKEGRVTWIQLTRSCMALTSFLSVRLLREELQLLQEPGSYVGEVIKVMGKTKVLVKVQPEGKYGQSFMDLLLFSYTRGRSVDLSKRGSKSV